MGTRSPASGIAQSVALLHLILCRYIIANDLSHAATAAMRRNIEINGLGPHPDEPVPEGADAEVHALGKVRVSEADAW